jgi:hypothetical protein
MNIQFNSHLIHDAATMKFCIVFAPAILAGATLAAPTEKSPAPPGGWESIEHPGDTGENLPYYPPPPGGWGNVNYPPLSASTLSHCHLLLQAPTVS